MCQRIQMRSKLQSLYYLVLKVRVLKYVYVYVFKTYPRFQYLDHHHHIPFDHGDIHPHHKLVIGHNLPSAGKDL